MKNKGRDELEAEVAQLREERAACIAGTTAKWEHVVATERAAHEATKAALCIYRNSIRDLEAAEARVAELVERHGELSERTVLAEARVAELEAEVARLRDELAGWRFRAESAEGRVEQLQRDVDRFSHGKLALRCEAAEARVAKLERQRDDARRRYYTEAQTRIACDAALDQARGLLERCQYAVPSVLTELLDAVSAWLAAHPAPKGNG